MWSQFKLIMRMSRWKCDVKIARSETCTPWSVSTLHHSAVGLPSTTVTTLFLPRLTWGCMLELTKDVLCCDFFSFKVHINFHLTDTFPAVLAEHNCPTSSWVLGLPWMVTLKSLFYPLLTWTLRIGWGASQAMGWLVRGLAGRAGEYRDLNIAIEREEEKL